MKKFSIVIKNVDDAGEIARILHEHANALEGKGYLTPTKLYDAGGKVVGFVAIDGKTPFLGLWEK